MNKQGIPSLDLHDFLKGGESKATFVKQIGSAYSDIGFIAVKNHGISEALLAALYEQVAAFFALPKEIKSQYEDGQGGQRGYTSFGKEHAKGNPNKDLKEFWHFGREVSAEDPLKNVYPENKWVKELPSFNQVGMEVYAALDQLGSQILRAIALYLNLDETYFESKTQNGNSILRPIHYPPITSEPEHSIRAGEHEDINLITLLIGASAEGLQVLNKQNEWVAITQVEEHIVVNVGDMLQRLTNNMLCSTTHRVVNPPRESWHIPRYSIPFFLHPRPEMDLSCLPSCVSENNPLQYAPITAGEYLEERLREIGLLK
jgi:isopenicillin N synthase-like dioxygenase